jgi:glutamate racemase
MSRAPNILIFDSGLGGLTVFAEVARLLPGVRLIYGADDAAFPYGELDEGSLVARVLAVMDRLIERCEPDIIVVACNTASTLALSHLRARFLQIPFVGTVPAIKPAASQSRSGMISVLATPGTVARDYTRELIRKYAAHCEVTLAGSSLLAPLAEAFMHGRAVEDAAIAREIAPAFVSTEKGRTDCIVLACTHYPLLLSHFERLAPWAVAWIDPAPAIARRTAQVLREQLAFPEADATAAAAPPAFAVFTAPAEHHSQLAKVLHLCGVDKVVFEPMPLSGVRQKSDNAAPA